MPACVEVKGVLSDTVNGGESPETPFVSLIEFIAARARDLRQKHNLTQDQTASLLGTDLKWYQRVEWAKKDVQASTIERLAALYGISPLDFLAKEMPENTKVKLKSAGAPHKPRQSRSRKATPKAK